MGGRVLIRSVRRGFNEKKQEKANAKILLMLLVFNTLKYYFPDILRKKADNIRL